MFNFVLGEVAGPLARRIGTLLAGVLTGLGVAVETVAAIEVGVVALMLVTVDLVLSKKWRTLKGVK